jgi:hypothetical protein
MHSTSMTTRMAVAALLMLAGCATSSSGRRYTIRVEDESGQPLAGARIQASFWYDQVVGGKLRGCTMRVIASGEADPGGIFKFTAEDPVGSRRACSGSPVWVRYRDWPDYYAQLETDMREALRGGEAERFNDRFVRHPDGETALAVRLAPARTVRGTIRWRTQPGCEELPEVLAQELFRGGVVVLRDSGQVDPGGSFALTGLGAGRVLIVARYCRVAVNRELDSHPGAPVEIEIPATENEAP